MFKIEIKGEAKPHFNTGKMLNVDIKKLDGIECQDNFTEYFDRNSYTGQIERGAYLKFVYENGKLFSTTTVYTSKRKLTSEELQDLKDYTIGQWSDGIGEGFEQEPCCEINRREVYISPWFNGQVITVTQTEI